jgi:hypothetical protein
MFCKDSHKPPKCHASRGGATLWLGEAVAPQSHKVLQKNKNKNYFKKNLLKNTIFIFEKNKPLKINFLPPIFFFFLWHPQATR